MLFISQKNQVWYNFEDEVKEKLFLKIYNCQNLNKLKYSNSTNKALALLSLIQND